MTGNNTERPSYECSSHRDLLTTPACRSVAAATVDDAVARMLLDALTPEQVALALSAADEVAGRRQRVSRAAELAVERARYEAGRALEAARDAQPPLPGRAELEKLAADLPGLWHAPATSSKDRKRLLRTLIADITLLPEQQPGQVRIGIRWHTGATDELVTDRPIHSGTAKRTPAAAVELARQLGPATSNDELARRLNAAGLTTGHGRPFDVKAVQWIRHAYNIPAPAPYAGGEIPVAEAARRPGCTTSVIYYWIESAQFDARRGPSGRLCIPWTSNIEAACRRRIAGSGHLNPAARRTRPRNRPQRHEAAAVTAGTTRHDHTANP